MTGSLKPKTYQCYIRKKSKNAYKKRKNENFEKQKRFFNNGSMPMKLHILKVLYGLESHAKDGHKEKNRFTDM